MKIQVYKTQGCAKCQEFSRNLELAMKELDLNISLIEEINLDKARDMDIRGCPTLILNNEVKSSGEALSVDELKKLLKEE